VQARAEYSKTEAGKLSHQKSREKWLEDNRIKRAAHVIYGNWFRYNKETKPTSCTVCGSVKRLEAHHDDYFKPLEARYLCHKCHVSWHNENGEGLNGVTKQETK
jgi:transposase-like protein